MKHIAIDGPAAAGKTTLAKNLSKRTGILYVDTGKMFRAMSLYLLNRGIDISDKNAVEEEARHIPASEITAPGNLDALRTEKVGFAASSIGAYPAVRERILTLQQFLTRNSDVIMEGRDIGTVVLKDAQLKIFLTATSETRARRRCSELAKKSMPFCFDEVLCDIRQRDYQDMHREIAPLMQAEDAILLDTSNLSIKQVEERAMELFLRTEEKEKREGGLL